MKKLLSLLLVLLVCLGIFVACGEEEVSLLDQAKTNLNALYKTKYDGQVTGSDYELVSQVKIDGVTLTVEWSVNVTEGVTVSKLDNGMTLIDVIDEAAQDIPYVLTATIKDAEGNTLQVSYNCTVPKFKVNTFAEYAAAKDEASLVIEGVVSGVFSKATGSQANGLYIQDLNNEGGYYVYNLTDDPNGVIEVGMTVQVRGKKDLYNGTYELIDASVTILNDGAKTEVVPVDYTSILSGATALNDAALVEKQGMLVTIKGVTIDEPGDNGYYYFLLGNHKVYLRISSSNNATTKEALETIKANFAANRGNTADVTGVISIYSGNFYLSPVSADAFANFVEPERNDAEKVAFELDSINIPANITKATTLTLPLVGSKYDTVTIVWVSDNAAAVVGENGAITITVPDAETEVKLTATATCGEATATKEFTITLSKTLTSIKDALDLGVAQESYTTDKYLVGGVITEVKNTKYGNVVISDGFNSILVYGLYSADGSVRYDAMETKPVVGDYIVALGIIGQYEGTAQMKNGWLVTHTTSTSIEDANTLGNTFDKNNYTEDKHLVTGVITEVQNEKYGNVVISDGTHSILVYGLYSATGAVRYDAMETKPVVGDTITVLGVVGKYDAPQLKNAWLVGYTAGTGSDTPVDPDPEDPEVPTFPEGVVDPVVGPAYNIGIINPNKDNNVYYISGGMAATYYLATNSDVASALDFYLEATEGGYYLYYLDGTTKTYINYTVNGSHVNSVYATTAETVFTYDATLKTLSTDVNGEAYILGTNNSGTYATVGPVKASADPFYCFFYAVEGSDTPVDPEPTEPTAVEGSIDIGENTLTIEANTYVNAVVYAMGSYTITWNDETVVVLVNDVAIASGDVVEFPNPRLSMTTLTVYGADYAAATVTLTIAEYVAPSTNVSVVLGENVVNVTDIDWGTTVEFTAPAAGDYTFVPVDNAVIIYDYTNYFIGSDEILTLNLTEGQVVSFSVLTANWQAGDATITIVEGTEVPDLGGGEEVEVSTADLILGNNSVSAESVKFTYTAAGEIVLVVTPGNPVMGPLDYTYTINSGDAVAMVAGEAVEITLAANDVLVVSAVGTGYGTIIVSEKTEGGEDVGGEGGEDVGGEPVTGTVVYLAVHAGGRKLMVTIDTVAGTMVITRSDMTGNFTGGATTVNYTYAFDGTDVTYALVDASSAITTMTFDASGAPVSITWGSQVYENFEVQGGEEEPEEPEVHVCADTDGDYLCDDDTCGLVVEPADGTVLTIPEAIKLATATGTTKTTGKFYVVGIVTKVGNSMTIKDADGNEISLYVVYASEDHSTDNKYNAFTGDKPGLGDTATFYGNLNCSYSGAARFYEVHWTEFTKHTCEYAEGVCTICGAAEPVTGPITSIADALAAAEGAEVELTGTVVEIREAWSSYNNMSAWISDGTNRILVWRMVTKVYMGDVITVTGVIGQYDSVNQVAAGSTAVVVTPHTCDWVDATCTVPQTCKVCGATQGEALGHNMVDGVCANGCGLQEGETLTTLTISMADIATANNWENAIQYLTFTHEGFTFTASAGTNNGKYYTSGGGSWRFYSSESGTLTITAPEGKTIKSINITWSQGGLSCNGTAMSSGIATTVSGNEIVISATAKTFITAIEIVYA